MKKQDDFNTKAPKKEKITIENGSTYPNGNHIPGDSVDKHKALEEANIILTGDEIKQQNENL